MFLPQMSQDDERNGYAGSLDNNGNMVSPTTALFPDISNNPSASSLYQALAQQQQQGLTVPEGYTSGSLHPYLSRPPSLSPSSQSAQLYNSTSNYSTSNQGLSPHSLSSPNSTFSYSDPGANFDEMMLNNSYSSTDLDALLFQADILPPTSKDGQSQQQAFFLPQGSNFGQGQDLSQLGLSFDQSNELLKLVNGQSAANYQRRVSDASDVFSLASQPNSMTIQTPSLPPHAMHINNSMSDGESNASWRSAGAFSPNGMKFGLNSEYMCTFFSAHADMMQPSNRSTRPFRSKRLHSKLSRPKPRSQLQRHRKRPKPRTSPAPMAPHPPSASTTRLKGDIGKKYRLPKPTYEIACLPCEFYTALRPRSRKRPPTYSQRMAPSTD